MVPTNDSKVDPFILSQWSDRRVAQKKFRERQKARVAKNNKRLEEMEEKLERVLQEKKDLDSTNRLLSHTLQVNNTHFGELQSQQARPLDPSPLPGFSADIVLHGLLGTCERVSLPSDGPLHQTAEVAVYFDPRLG